MKVTLNKIRLYNLFGIAKIGVGNIDEVRINDETYKVKDLGVGVINWLRKYANSDAVLSDAIRKRLRNVGKYN
jgi:hypothetical protein